MSDTKQRVLVIWGSLRKGSFNKALAHALPELAPTRMELVMARTIGDFPLYNADDQEASGFPKPVEELGEQVRAADGVIIVTPEYNFSVPGVLKNAIDWVSRLPDQPFAHKPVAIESASPSPLGGARAQYHLRQTMVFLEAHVFNKPEIFVSFASKKFDEKTGKLTDETTRDFIRKQLEGFSHFIDRVSIGDA